MQNRQYKLGVQTKGLERISFGLIRSSGHRVMLAFAGHDEGLELRINLIGLRSSGAHAGSTSWQAHHPMRAASNGAGLGQPGPKRPAQAVNALADAVTRRGPRVAELRGHLPAEEHREADEEGHANYQRRSQRREILPHSRFLSAARGGR